MEASEILERIELGEDSTTQFKENITERASLAEEMVALNGGFLKKNFNGCFKKHKKSMPMNCRSMTPVSMILTINY
ncbi:MAG: hypothetical protein ABFC57_17225 [Veillonellales bacterium]